MTTVVVMQRTSESSLRAWPAHAETAAAALESIGLQIRADAVRKAATIRDAAAVLREANQVCDDICDWDRFLTRSGAGTTEAEHARVNRVSAVVLAALWKLEELARRAA